MKKNIGFVVASVLIASCADSSSGRMVYTPGSMSQIVSEGMSQQAQAELLLRAWGEELKNCDASPYASFDDFVGSVEGGGDHLDISYVLPDVQERFYTSLPLNVRATMSRRSCNEYLRVNSFSLLMNQLVQNPAAPASQRQAASNVANVIRCFLNASHDYVIFENTVLPIWQ